MKATLHDEIAKALKKACADMVTDLVVDIAYKRDGQYYCIHKTKGEITAVEMATLLYKSL